MLILPVFLFFVTWIFIDPNLVNIVKTTIFVMAEVFLDFWVFGGICTKDFHGIEYLKSSIKGKEILRCALILDVFRKLIWMVLVAAGTYLYFPIFGVKNPAPINWISFIAMILFGHGTVMLGNLLERYAPSYAIAMLISYGAAVMMIIGYLLCYTEPIFMLVISFGCSLGFSWLSVWKVMRKVEGSYYDE